jgi:hypothetical protein
VASRPNKTLLQKPETAISGIALLTRNKSAGDFPGVF